MVKKLSFIEHLEELRTRVLKSFLFIIIFSVFSYLVTDTVLGFIVRPIGNLVFIAPQEAFISKIKLALLIALYLSSPFIFYQIWQFLSAGLEGKERRFVFLFGFSSFIIFFLGSFFGYFIIAPVGIKFLLGFGSDFVIPMISVGKYISFVGLLTLTFGIIFQLPIIIFFLSKVGILDSQVLSRNRKYAVVIVFIIGAVVTPPDVITQCLIALPLLVLYEVSILLSKVSYRK